MRMFSARVTALGCSAVLLWCVSSEAAVMSLKAVKRNGANITPTNTLTINPNDTVEANVLVSGWAADLPLGVRIYQAKLVGTGFVADPGTNGNVYPLGWKAPLAQLPCSVDADCPAAYPDCLTSPPTGCVQLGHNPSLGALIEFAKPDYIFAGQSVTSDINTTRLSYSYFGQMTDSIGITDTGVPKYLATLRMQASNNACGVFTINLSQEESF